MSSRIFESTKNNINYTTAVLREKKNTKTKAVFWKVNRTNPEDGIGLKIGRYKNDMWEDPVSAKPKSELTLDHEELTSLIRFISDNYKPLMLGAGTYIKADSLDVELAKKLQNAFSKSDSNGVAKFLVQNNILSNDVTGLVEFCHRESALLEYEKALNEDRPESFWQKWFEKNNWILGNEFVRILDDRNIDTKNIADYLMETFDGFVDIVEIKRPDGELQFWSKTRDHDNLIPSQDLIKAITQTQNYVQSLEEEMDSRKTQERLDGSIIVKPRATLIFGRSDNWSDDERKAFRILNAGYKDLTILTYDQVLSRAKKELNIAKDQDNKRKKS